MKIICVVRHLNLRVFAVYGQTVPSTEQGCFFTGDVGRAMATNRYRLVWKAASFGTDVNARRD